MATNKNFEYLGNNFQIQLLNQIIVDKDFSHSIIEVIENNYFENKYFKIIIQMVREYYKKYNHTPSFETLEQVAKSELQQATAVKVVLDTIKKIKDCPIDGVDFVQEKALKFCKQQELQKVMKQAQKIIEVLEDDYRHPIPMGIPGIDRLLKGGLAKGEIGVILAPTGVGKSTILTKISNHAFNLGFNVLQIFFEDNPKVIQRKHFTLWTKVHPDELSEKKEEVMQKVREIENDMPNELILKKLPSDTKTMMQIKNEIRKMIADGIKIDMVVLDYIDCVVPDKNLGDEWKSEGSVMRGFEAMCHELNIVGWTATQGNRSSISSEVVTTDQMGGSIKRAQVGHVIISVAKTLQQKEMKLATIAITKSRIGDDGVVFENCKFDNAMIDIDTESTTTFLGIEEQKEERQRQRVKELLAKRQQRQENQSNN